MAELTIRTASSCLMGKEIRSQLHSNGIFVCDTVASLYRDLDNGLAPINVFFRWLPLPVYFRRDRANKIMTETFRKIIAKRRSSNDDKNHDVLQALMNAEYKDGSKVIFSYRR
jgi:cytochrome P450